jgi:hypothetical protein
MKEFWEITYERGIATNAVWAMQPAFELRGLTSTQHSDNVGTLPELAQVVADKEGDLSDAYESRNDYFAKLTSLIVRVPGVIDGMLTEDDDLHGQLDGIYSIDGQSSLASALRRARLVAPLWEDFNAQLAAATPPKPAFTIDYKQPGSDLPPVTVTQADFAALIGNCEAALTSVAGVNRSVTNAKSALASLDKRVDRDNKRWYKAWVKNYPEGTPEGDAALSQIPAEQGTPEPNALEISSVDSHTNHTATINYPATGGEHATTLELLYKLPDEEDFGHAVPVTRPSQVVGPFPAGTVVIFVTRVSNSTPGVVFGTPRSAVL